MNSFGLYIYQWMKQKYEKLHHKVEEEYPYLIELESGEVVNIKGFSNA